MSPHTLATILVAIHSISFVIGIYILYTNWPYFSMQKSRRLNNDRMATESFAKLMKDAEFKMCISDHGNIMDESVYENDQIIRVVEEKLEDSPNFRIQCGFTSEDENKFRKRLEGHPRVVIINRTEEPGLEYPHYKIIDNGVKAYLSQHALGSKERMVQRYDFSRTKIRRGQPDVINEYLGDYLEDIETTFGGQAG